LLSVKVVEQSVLVLFQKLLNKYDVWEGGAHPLLPVFIRFWVCSSAGRAAVSKAAGRGFEPLRTRKKGDST
jgi:hypothetical protein